MGITSRIDRGRRVILSAGKGILTRSDWIKYTEWVWSDPEVSLYDKLVDLRGVERIDMTGAETRDAASRIPKAGSLRADYRVAIVAVSDAVFGMSRMYEMLRAGTMGEVRSFRDLDEAREWLGIVEEK